MEDAVESYTALGVPPQQQHTALSLLIKLFRNIVVNPSEEKYRTIRKTNATIRTKLFFEGSPSGDVAASILRELGFIDKGETFELPFAVAARDVADAADLLEGIVESMGEIPQEATPPPSAPPAQLPSPTSPPRSADKPRPKPKPTDFARRDDWEMQRKKADAELAQLRAERSRQFDADRSNPARAQATSGATVSTPNRVLPSSQGNSSSGSRGIWSTLFGGGGNDSSSNNRNTGTRRGGYKTISDLPPAPRKGG